MKDGPVNGLTPLQRSILSHRLRRMQRRELPPPEVDASFLPGVSDRLPSPTEQADNLILWVGDNQSSPEQLVTISNDAELASWIGTSISRNLHDEGLFWLLQQSPVKRLIENYANISDPSRLQLTFEGWERFEALKRNVVESRKAFMAMKFGDDELNRVVHTCFKPAVERTGFKLKLLTEDQPAGLIDDQLRVALRTSRFVIADLTHANNGAYWEAGFAEGLGLPVIYTCRKDKWGDTHFDTSHLNTVIWNPLELAIAGAKLTAMIQATLPAEANMAD
jgi:hypothetical protein